MVRKRVLLFVAVLFLGIILYLGYPFSVFFKIIPPYDKPMPSQITPEGVASLSAKSCAKCHKEIVEEWESSIHSKSYTDPTFQAYFKKDGSLWVCLNCHTPLQNQQEYLVKGFRFGSIYRPILEKNPDFDPVLRDEGLTCVVCHLRDGVIIGPYDDANAPHPTRYDPSIKTAEFCLGCKQVPSASRTFLTTEACNTGFEWQEGPYAEKGVICQDCHMPKVNRSIVRESDEEHEHGEEKVREWPIRETGRHLWRGGHDQEMLKKAITVELNPSKSVFKPGEEALIYLNLTNSGAGHEFPTGDPGRYVTISFKSVDGNGKIIKEKTHRIGRNIVWGPVPLELSDKRLKPLESRVFAFSFRVPEDVGEIELKVSVNYNFLSESVKDRMVKKYGLPEDTVIAINLYETEERLMVT